MKTEMNTVGRYISHISKDIHACHRHQLRDFDMGWGQFKILLLLMHEEGLKQEDISARLEIDKTTVTRTLNKLEASGFIRRVADPGDRRIHRIYMTEKSLEQKAYLTRLREEINTYLLEGFTASETEQLMAYLIRLKQNSHRLVEDMKHESI